MGFWSSVGNFLNPVSQVNNLVEGVEGLVKDPFNPVAALQIGGALGDPISAWASGEIDNILNPKIPEQQDPGLGVNTSSMMVSIPIVYGRTFVGGNRIYTNVVGQTGKDLCLAYCIAEGEITSIEQIYFNKKPLLVDNSSFTYGTIDKSKITDEFKEYVKVAVANGSANQKALTLIKSNSDGEWTDNHKCTKRAIAGFVLTRSKDTDAPILGIPNVEFIVKGRKVKIVGSNRIAFSDNPVDCLYDYMTDKLAGSGIDPSLIDLPSFVSARKYCSDKGFKLQGVIKQDKTYKSTFSEILSVFGGSLADVDGKIFLSVDMASKPVAKVNEKDFVKPMQISFPKVSDYFNTLEVSYRNEDKNDQDILIYPKQLSSSVIAKDKGRVITKRLDLRLVKDKNHIDYLASKAFRKERGRLGIEITLTRSGWYLKPFDVIEVSHEEFKWQDRKFRILELNKENSNICVLKCVEYHDSDYEPANLDSINSNLAPSRFNSFTNTPPQPYNLEFNKLSTKYSTSGKIIWNVKDSISVSGYLVQYKLSTVNTWTMLGTASDTHWIVRNLKAAKYDFRVASINASGTYSDFTIIKNIGISDETVFPKVSGIKLITTNTDKTIADSKDFNLTWDDMDAKELIASNNDPESDSQEKIGAYREYYEVSVYRGQNLVRTELVKDNSFVYSLDLNKADGISRTVTFDVKIKGKGGNYSPPSKFTAVNRQNGAATGVLVKGGLAGMFIQFDYPKDDDYAGCEIHISNTKGFSPNPATLEADVKNTNTFSKAYAQDQKGTYYCRLGVYDVFGKDSIQYTSEFVFTLEDVNIHIDTVDVSDLANDLKGKIAKIDTNATGIANNGTLIKNETTDRKTADSALSGRIDTTLAKVGDNVAAIKKESEARATVTNALSKDITTVQTTVNENTASIKDVSTSIDGVKAQRVIKTDANGVVAGIGILSDSTTQKSEVSILADKFYILGSKAQANTADAMIPFAVKKDPVDGKTKAFINEAAIAKASIGNAKIQDVDAGKIVTGHLRAATDIIAGNGNNTIKLHGGGTTLGDKTILLSAGNSVDSKAPFRVHADGSIFANDGEFNGTVRADKIVGDTSVGLRTQFRVSAIVSQDSSTQPSRVVNRTYPFKNASNSDLVVTIADTVSRDRYVSVSLPRLSSYMGYRRDSKGVYTTTFSFKGEYTTTTGDKYSDEDRMGYTRDFRQVMSNTSDPNNDGVKPIDVNAKLMIFIPKNTKGTIKFQVTMNCHFNQFTKINNLYMGYSSLGTHTSDVSGYLGDITIFAKSSQITSN